MHLKMGTLSGRRRVFRQCPGYGAAPRGLRCVFPKPLHDTALALVTEVGLRQGLIGSDFPTQPHAAHEGLQLQWVPRRLRRCLWPGTATTSGLEPPPRKVRQTRPWDAGPW